MSGLVVSTNGRVLEGATVVVLDGTNSGRSTTTNSFGRYELTGLTPANANLAARLSGYQEQRKGLYIEGAATLDFSLPPEQRPQPSPEDARITITVDRVASGGNYIEYRFTAVSNVELTGYEWNFGPASANSGKQVEQYLYTSEGDYTVRVDAKTRDGNRPVSGSIPLSVRF